MKKMFFIAVAMFAMLTTVSCGKETITERIEVRKGNLIQTLFTLVMEFPQLLWEK